MKYLNYNKLFILSNILYTIGTALWSGTIYLFMQHIGYTINQINFFLIIFWLTSFIFEFPTGIISDNIGQLKTIILSCITRCLGLILIFFSAKNVLLLYFGAILTGLGSALYSGTCSSHIFNLFNDNKLNISCEKFISINNTLSTIFSLLSGYLGSQLLGNINLKYPILLGSLILLLPIPILLYLSKFDNYNHQNNKIINFKTNLLNTINLLKQNKKLLNYIIIFLPILIITTTPFNQWQLFFQQNQSTIQTGNILIFINLSSILGNYLIRYISLKNNTKQIIFNELFIITISIIMCIITSKTLIISIIFFILHTLFVTINEIHQEIILQNNINSYNRNSIISFFNTLQSLLSIVVIGINAVLCHFFSLATTWIILAIIGFISFSILFFIKRKTYD